MRLRAIPLLVVIVASVAALGAWTDRTKVKLDQAPPVAHQSQPWDAVVEISRRGRRLDGFRPTFEVTDAAGGTREVSAHALGSGRYRISVVFPQSGFYQYKLVVAKRVMARGSIYAIPR